MRRTLVYAALLGVIVLGLGAGTGALAGVMFKWSSDTTSRASASSQEEDPSSPQRAPESEEGVFIHIATEDNVSSNSTYIDYPLANANPSALLFVTPNWNPEGSSNIYNDHPIGVWYDPTAQRWAIFNQDRETMPVGTAFNVRCREGL